MPWLTKSRFLSGLQCHKRLWFEIHQPLEEETPPNLQMLQGRQFDEIVQSLQPGRVISRDRGMPAAISETNTIMARGALAPATLYQPAFRAGDLAVIVDILRREGDAFTLTEVKASTQVKVIHIPDVSFQALVVRRAGIPVTTVRLGHVNKQFVLRRQGDYDGLMIEEDITAAVEDYLPRASAASEQLLDITRQPAAPVLDTGAHCDDPYPCPFFQRCSANQTPRPTYPVNVLPKGGKIIDGLLADGFRDLCVVPADRLTSPTHLRVHAATVSGIPHFDVSPTRALRLLPRPHTYLDFETINSAIPEIIGTRPYEQMPFQWSVHAEDAAGRFSHFEYLAIESFGDFAALAHALVQATPTEGPVFAYNAAFENNVLLQLADLVPAHAVALRQIAGRLFDLLPVTRQAWYHRDMLGSWSIKKVIPTIAPSLGYGELDHVQDGGGAQEAFTQLRAGGLDQERDQELRKALLKYCRLDTWAMVILRRFLCEEAIDVEDCAT